MVGIAAGDTDADAEKMMRDLLRLKIFPEKGVRGQRMSEDVKTTRGDILLIPQFTLYARLKSGRPSFHRAMPPGEAQPFFDRFVGSVRNAHADGNVECGMFAEHMEVSIVNSGPITIIIDTADSGKSKSHGEHGSDTK